MMVEFNMSQIGQRIAQLRKELNITQTELADKLHVSYQAVSNWERGQSMPDISKLPELCTIFNISMDALIGNRHISEQINRLSKDDRNEQEISVDDLLIIAPISKPDQIEKWVPTKALSIDQIIDLCPFMEKETIDTFVANRDKDVPLLPEHLYQLAPFMSQDCFDELVKSFLKSDRKIGRYQSLAPFVHPDTLVSLINRVQESGGYEDIRLDINNGEEHQYKIFCGIKIFSDTQASEDHTAIRSRRVYLTMKGKWVYYEKQTFNYNCWRENMESPVYFTPNASRPKSTFRVLNSLEELIPHIGEINVNELRKKTTPKKITIEQLDI